MPNILSLLIITPLVGVLLILLVSRGRDDSHHTAKSIGLIISLMNLVFSFFMLKNFDHTFVSFQMEEKYHWIDLINSSIHLGVDGISLYFIVLTALLVPGFYISLFIS
jgi:NADH-quinone oxidoreductase subunit M